MKPSIDGTEFGSITISGELYEHDVVIRSIDRIIVCEESVLWFAGG